MPCILHQYDRISTYTLEFLQNFSRRIMIIENIINKLLKDDSLNKSNDLSNFMKALSFIDILRNTHTFETNSQFKDLTMEMDKFKKAAMEIMNTAKLYNINCQNL
ncbi:hypothetical protein NSA52_05130 [Clostridium sporogenes]|uniref:hypothetical protein n=1 Tax=Clostridium sporogenes TaxID=1509 RepID=UPI002149B659|nr:hypothetical protein [Clostridium sporogenes]MCR1973516.1 hypothetical protein [Clostridium sporogenes]